MLILSEVLKPCQKMYSPECTTNGGCLWSVVLRTACGHDSGLADAKRDSDAGSGTGELTYSPEGC